MNAATSLQLSRRTVEFCWRATLIRIQQLRDQEQALRADPEAADSLQSTIAALDKATSAQVELERALWPR